MLLIIAIVIIIAWILFGHTIMISGAEIRSVPYYNVTEAYSPIMLTPTWNTIFRIVLTISGTIFGVISNGFFVTTFFVADEVRKIGNIFLVCVGLAEFLITGGVMILSSSVTLTDQLDTIDMCQGIQTLVATSTYCYSAYYFLVAFVTWCRVNQIRKIFVRCLHCFLALICLLVFLVSLGLAIAGTYFNYDIDYCRRRHQGNAVFRFSTTIYHIFSFFLSTTILIVSYVKLDHQTRGCGRYRRSYQFRRDVSMMKLNVVMIVLFVAFWAPFMIVVNYYPDAPNNVFYNTAALAILRSILATGVYCMSNNIFSRSYNSLFNYCFCKINIQSNRPRANGNVARQNGDVKTHILMLPPANVRAQEDL